MAARRFNVQSYLTGGSRDTGSNLTEIVRSFLNADEALSIHQPFGKLIVCLLYTSALYDMELDRTELHDISGEHPEIKKELLKAYEEWAQETGVKSREKILEIIKNSEV